MTQFDQHDQRFDQRYQEVGTQFNAGRDIHLHQSPLTVAEQQRKHNRAAMLKRVKSIWIEEVLEPSLHGASQIALELQHKPSAVITPWWVVLREFQQTRPLMPTNTSIKQVYDQANGELLILGEPGSGKTTLLLELARDLLEQARQQERHPIPVIFTLSSWATKRLPLSEWLVEELNVKYQIPRPMAVSWIATGQVLPMLDGLDEVEEIHRAACVEAINAYRQAHGLLPTVVCSRQDDYFALPIRMQLRTAVIVQPLTAGQIETYLTSAGEPLVALRQALQENADLQTLASTPLMLTILTLAYRGTPLNEIASLGTLPDKRQQIFDTYVKRMLMRRSPLKAGTAQQVVQWLTFLATRMREHNQTVFYLEQMQPDWLPHVQRRSYAWLAVRLPALLLGILAGLAITFLFYKVYDLLSLLPNVALGGLLGWLFSRPAPARGSLPHQAGGYYQGHMRLLWRDLLPSIIVGLTVGLTFGLERRLGYGNIEGYGPSDWLLDGSIVGVMLGFSSLLLCWLLPMRTSTHATVSKNNGTKRQWKKLVPLIQTVHGQRTLLVMAIVGVGYGLSHKLRVGLSYGLSVGLNYTLSDALSRGLDNALSSGLTSVLASLILKAQAEGISLAEHLRWTWNSLMRSLFTPEHMRTAFLIASVVGVISGLSIGLSSGFYGLSIGLSLGLREGLRLGLGNGLTYWILLGLFQGVSSERIEDSSRRIPNQGIQRSLYNSILMAFISGGIIGVIGTLSWGLSYGLDDGLSNGLSEGLSYGLDNGWSLAVCGGLLVCSMSGGLAVLRHGIMRLLLRRARATPHHYVRFLDEAASRILLRKVGGGYSFVHRLLLDYFADAEKKDRK